MHALTTWYCPHTLPPEAMWISDLKTFLKVAELYWMGWITKQAFIMRVRDRQPPGLTSKPVRSCWPHSPHQQEIIPRDGTVAVQVYLRALSTAAGRGTEHMQWWVLTIVGRLARTSPGLPFLPLLFPTCPFQSPVGLTSTSMLCM